MTFAGALGRVGTDPPQDPLACLEVLLDNCFIPFSATTRTRPADGVPAPESPPISPPMRLSGLNPPPPPPRASRST